MRPEPDVSSAVHAQDRNIKNSDVVVWHSFGVTHVPRIEDWCACHYLPCSVSFAWPASNAASGS
jgi:Cu2+-containing amine oxidase